MKKSKATGQSESKRSRSSDIVTDSCDVASDAVRGSCDIVTKSCNIVTSTVKANPLKSIGAAALVCLFLL